MNPNAEKSKKILLVDDEPQSLISFSVMLQSASMTNVLTEEDSRKVMGLLGSVEVGVCVLDLMMPNITGSELLHLIKRDYPHIQVIIVTAANDVEKAVECMKAGASDYIVKPVEKSHFINSIKGALEMQSLREEFYSLKEQFIEDRLLREDCFSSIITGSRKMRVIFQYLEVIAPTDHPVLIVGETGVGKELIARALHDLSGRTGDFVAVDAAGLDDTVFSDTIFGHRKGAFTGADRDRDGLIVKASEGTLFLDEIGDLNESSQIKLLRLLQEKTYYPLGSDVPKVSDARIVVASNKNIKGLISSGKFRKDLYYRLFAYNVNIPPLRARTEDIPLLVEHFIDEAARSLGKKAPKVPPQLYTLLSNYAFNGNVRELQAMVLNAVTRHSSGILSMESFKEVIHFERNAEEDGLSEAPSMPEGVTGRGDELPTLKQAERCLIDEAMKRADGNQSIAATMLGIDRKTLNKRLKRYSES